MLKKQVNRLRGFVVNKVLFCYFGRFFDHTADIPGHPLYTLFYLKSIAKYYNIEKFDVLYYDTMFPVYTYGESVFSVLQDKRIQLYSSLINKDNVTLQEALDTEYSMVFLKHRFRNYSRLADGCYDRFVYDKLYDKFKSKSILIDTDAELTSDEIIQHYNDTKNMTISLFSSNKYALRKYTTRIIPVQRDDISVNEALLKTDKLTFIGNMYGKKDLYPMLFDTYNNYKQLDIVLHGKWNTDTWYKVIKRQQRILGYNSLMMSIATINMSKEIYHTYDFMSPRIFEAMLLNTICFSTNSFVPKFYHPTDGIALSEKLKFLYEQYKTGKYRILFNKYVNEVYDTLESTIA